MFSFIISFNNDCNECFNNNIFIKKNKENTKKFDYLMKEEINYINDSIQYYNLSNLTIKGHHYNYNVKLNYEYILQFLFFQLLEIQLYQIFYLH